MPSQAVERGIARDERCEALAVEQFEGGVETGAEALEQCDPIDLLAALDEQRGGGQTVGRR